MAEHELDLLHHMIYGQYVIARVLTAYILNANGLADDVNESVKDLPTITIGGQRLSKEQTMVEVIEGRSRDIASQLAHYWYETLEEPFEQKE